VDFKDPSRSGHTQLSPISWAS